MSLLEPLLSDQVMLLFSPSYIFFRKRSKTILSHRGFSIFILVGSVSSDTAPMVLHKLFKTEWRPSEMTGYVWICRGKMSWR